MADAPSITFAYPKREHEALRDEIERAVTRVLRSGSYVLGPEVQAFEHAFSKYTGATHVVAVSSGTDALVCALIALGVEPGQEVIVPAFGFVAAAEAVVRVGAVPVFVDVEPHTLGPDPNACRSVLSKRTRAMIVMHLFGQAVDLASLHEVVGELPIVEDAAQAIGTKLRIDGSDAMDDHGQADDSRRSAARLAVPPNPVRSGNLLDDHGQADDSQRSAARLAVPPNPARSGSLLDDHGQADDSQRSAARLAVPPNPVRSGNLLDDHGQADDSQRSAARLAVPPNPVRSGSGARQVGAIERVGTFSFFPAKSLGAAGDAGAVTTTDPELAQRLRWARAHGATQAYVWQGPGGNYRMDAVQAALLTVKLGALDARLLRRKQIGRKLADVAISHGVQPLTGGSACEPTYAPFVLRLPARDEVLGRLRARGVDARVHYPTTLSESPVFRGVAGAGPWPEAHRATRELLSLPCSPELTDDEVQRLVDALCEVLHG